MMTCRQNSGLTEWNGFSPKPLMQLVGAEGFEPPAPCSQKRGEPSKINAFLTIPVMFTALDFNGLARESEIPAM
jgi:hypothetical protein